MSKKVFIFSLDSSIRKFLCHSKDYNIFFFSDYKIICSAIKNECPSIVLLDYHIAMKIGPDCIQQICKISVNTSVFIIAEKQNPDFQLYFKAVGIKDIISIPNEKDIFINKLNPFLEESFAFIKSALYLSFIIVQTSSRDSKTFKGSSSYDTLT